MITELQRQFRFCRRERKGADRARWQAGAAVEPVRRELMNHDLLDRCPSRSDTSSGGTTARSCIRYYPGLWTGTSIETIAQAVIDLAPPLPADPMSLYEERARCPRCGGSSQSYLWTDRYRLPDGLRRHLTVHTVLRNAA